jgi:hypothetical protein
MDWIDWIQKHLFTLVIIAGVLGQLYKAIRGQKDEEGEAPPAPSPGKSFEDPDADERARRIREDIQRKIAQRRREEAGAPVAPEPQPSAYDEAPPLMRDEDEVAPPPVVTRSIITERAPEAAAALQRLEAQRQAEILEQQAALADQMRELEAMKAAAQRRAAFEAASVNQQAAARTAARGALLDDLRDPTALRRAFVLREVLGPPVALR